MREYRPWSPERRRVATMLAAVRLHGSVGKAKIAHQRKIVSLLKKRKRLMTALQGVNALLSHHQQQAEKLK